jgi:hypothetical protein
MGVKVVLKVNMISVKNTEVVRDVNKMGVKVALEINPTSVVLTEVVIDVLIVLIGLTVEWVLVSMMDIVLLVLR